MRGRNRDLPNLTMLRDTYLIAIKKKFGLLEASSTSGWVDYKAYYMQL